MLVSLGIIITLIYVCDCIRRFIIFQCKRFRMEDTFYENLLLDIVGAVEMCSVSLEIGVVFKHYGYWCFAMILYLNIFYQCLRWPHIQPPCPYFHIVNYVSRKSKLTLVQVFIRCLVLIASGISTYHLISTSIWKLEIVDHHIGRIKETSSEHCRVPGKKETPICILMLSEFLGVFLLDVIIKIGVVDNPFFQKRSLFLISAIIPGIVLLGVSLAMEISGGMFNPMLASVLIGGCNGHSTIQHVMVYWVASTLGAVLADVMYPKIHHSIYGKSYHTKEKKKMK